MARDITKFRRHPERGSQDRSLIHSVLDATLLGHVGFIRNGRPSVIPTFVIRAGNDVLIHGSPASAPLRAVKTGAEICVTATILDGLVLARSAFNHSANYRSVMIYGKARFLTGEEKITALEHITERIAPGRLAHLRPMTRKEVAGTAVGAMGLDDATVKIRSGPPVDEPADYDLDIWAGVVPIETRFGPPVPDPANRNGLAVPDHVAALQW